MELNIIFTYVDNECKNWLNERNKFLLNIKVLIKSK